MRPLHLALTLAPASSRLRLPLLSLSPSVCPFFALPARLTPACISCFSGVRWLRCSGVSLLVSPFPFTVCVYLCRFFISFLHLLPPSPSPFLLLLLLRSWVIRPLTILRCHSKRISLLIAGKSFRSFVAVVVAVVWVSSLGLLWLSPVTVNVTVTVAITFTIYTLHMATSWQGIRVCFVF